MTRKRGFQHGSLFKRGKRKKVWVARFYEPEFGPNGIARFPRRSEVIGTVAELPTRSDAERVLAVRLRHINSGDYSLNAACTFGEFVERYWVPEVLPTLKYSTKKHYQYILKVHLLPCPSSKCRALIK